MKKFCIIGLGRFGYELALSLTKSGEKVLAIDDHENLVNAIKDHVHQAICLKICDQDTLKHLNISHKDIVIIGVAEDLAQSILLTTILKKELKIEKVIARAVSKIHEEILKLVGADIVVFPERDIAQKLCVSLKEK